MVGDSMEPIRILLVEDSPTDAALIIEVLTAKEPPDLSLDHVTTLSAAVGRLAGGAYDAVLLDLALPDSYGIDTVAVIREIAPDLPIVILTGTDDDEVARSALNLGAQDYVVKGQFSAEFLARGIRYAIERSRAEAEIAQLARFPGENPGVTLRLAADGALMYANPASAPLLAAWQCQVGEPVPAQWRQVADHALRSTARLQCEFIHGERTFELTFVPIVGHGYVNVYGVDITARKSAEARQKLAVDVLANLNRAAAGREVIGDTLSLIRDFVGFDAVGIRLREGEGYPYYVSNGLSDDFVQAENELCERDAEGNLVRDASGNPVLACMCGVIIRGRTDPSQPFFTEGGSFWTNSTTELLATTTEAERQGRTRNRCSSEGYESVALVPLRSGSETVGLLQLADRRRGALSPEIVGFFEGVGASIGIALARLRAAEERAQLVAAIEQAAEGIALFDIMGRAIYANRAIETIQPHSAAEFIGQPFDVLSGPHFGYRFPQMSENDAQEGGMWSGRVSNTRRDGTPCAVELSVSPIMDEAGSRTAYIATGRDVTSMVQLESQLRQAQKLEAIGTLAGGVAHDFNNLLMVITGNCEVALRSAPPSTDLAEPLNQVIAAAKRAANLTRQLLAFGRRQVMQPRVISLNTIVDDLGKMLRRLLPESIDMRTYLAPDLGETLADPGQIEQVIVNLAVNARDSMPDGGRLTIETMDVEVDAEYAQGRPQVSPGPYVVVAVTDTGCGMDADTLERIFEPFFTTKGPGAGTGLGLATVYGIVRQSGGGIWVYSEPGQGSTFKVYLPRVSADREAVDTTDADAPDAGRGGEVILLIEDENAVREVLVMGLRRQGYRVLPARDGNEAIQLAHQQATGPDIIVTDVVMPGMSGKQATDALLTLWPGTRVIFMTGYTDNAVIHHGVLDPGATLIEKPFTLDALVRTIQRKLQGERE